MTDRTITFAITLDPEALDRVVQHAVEEALERKVAEHVDAALSGSVYATETTEGPRLRRLAVALAGDALARLQRDPDPLRVAAAERMSGRLLGWLEKRMDEALKATPETPVRKAARELLDVALGRVKGGGA